MSILERLGLESDEATVYLDLLRHGSSTITDMARRTGLHRPNVYKRVGVLQRKQLVTHAVKGKTKFYAAESPEKLRSLVDQLQSQIDQELPELQALYEKKSNRPKLKYLEGIDGVKFVLEDLAQVAKKGEVYYRYSSRKPSTNVRKFIPKKYREAREKKQLERFVITSQTLKDTKNPRLERHIKVVPPSFDLFDHDITQIIYADRVAFLDYNTNTAFIIENEKLAQFQKKVFQLLFSKL